MDRSEYFFMDEGKIIYWMVVRNSENGNFKNAKFSSISPEDVASMEFEDTHQNYKVIYIEEGEEPRSMFRSLSYV
jgi:hypothetical protein